MIHVMTPKHPRWTEFVQRLFGPEGCDFHGEPGSGDGDPLIWNCDCSRDRPLSRAILESMTGIDVEASLKFFEQYGGYCDCEVIFNVQDSYFDSVANLN